MTCPHCQTPISDHPANRCLDALIAEKVMGWKPDYGNMDGDIPFYNKKILDKGGTYWDRAHKWSSSIEDAWEVVEKVNQDNAMTLRWYNPDGRTSTFGVSFGFGKKVWGNGSTAPLAICRAAIKAATEGTPEH